ncbi:MAG: ethanolamine ammonia-lyase subunit EutC [Proteobacteria bacterium]|nr:ethanolamine ammonia-lyase subunit EutC [Pseudomonadota bacterium]
MSSHSHDQTVPSAEPRDRLERDAFWERLRHVTPARIGLATTGASLATTPLLDFRIAHARARDAVTAPFDSAAFQAVLASSGQDVLGVSSMASDRREYLLRPDLGRQLAKADHLALAERARPCDLAIVLADGLSPAAVTRHGPPLLEKILPQLTAEGWRLSPLIVVERGRVGIGDAIATALGARAVLVMVGERPGLSVQESVGLYITWAPTGTTTDADRNCISNIWQFGLSYDAAAFRLHGLLKQMFVRRLSGVMLKDDAITDASGRSIDAVEGDDIGFDLQSR